MLRVSRYQFFFRFYRAMPLNPMSSKTSRTRECLNVEFESGRPSRRRKEQLQILLRSTFCPRPAKSRNNRETLHFGHRLKST